jgi:hypothetical protein
MIEQFENLKITNTIYDFPGVIHDCRIADFFIRP